MIILFSLEKGELFTWGYNEDKQLGIDNTHLRRVFEPTPVSLFARTTQENSLTEVAAISEDGVRFLPLRIKR